MIFESSLLESGGRSSRVCATLCSAAGQSAVAGVVILFSIVQTEVIALPRLATVIGAPVSQAPAVRQRASTSSVPSTGRIFRLPLMTYPSTNAPVAPSGFDDAPVIPGGNFLGGDHASFNVGDIIGILAPKPHAAQPEKPAPPPPKTVSTAPHRITVSTGVQAAKLIEQVKPVYPPLAKQARIQGVVRLLAVITIDGSIQSLRVESGHPLLAPAAVDAVRQWRYQPTLLNDQPVEVITQIQVIFTLTQ